MTDFVPSHDPKRELLRHAVATVAYRGSKTIRNAPAGFADFQGAARLRTPGQIVAHIGDLFDWALTIAMGTEKWNDSVPRPWDQESERFFATLKKFDDFLASDQPAQAPMEKFLQGPIADALTHIGQLAMLRRMAGSPITSENYSRAEVTTGRVEADQIPPKHEFYPM